MYQREIAAFEDVGDQGEVWFGEEAVEKMVQWVEEVLPREETETEQSSSSLKILDIGTGNGHLLFALVEAGYRPESMLGIDYSEPSVQLARRIGESRGQGCERVRFECCDIFEEQAPSLFLREWDLILDKGTYDAICLNTHEKETEEQTTTKDGEGNESELYSTLPMKKYPRLIAQLLRLHPQAKCLITSCNWSENELVRQFSSAGLAKHSSVRWPTFSFGGATGSRVCTVAFHLPSAMKGAEAESTLSRAMTSL